MVKPENSGRASAPRVTRTAAVTRIARLAWLRSTSAPAGVCASSPATTADRHDEADRGFVPLLNGQQVDGEVWAQAVANVGDKEVQRIEPPPVLRTVVVYHNGPLNTKKAPSAINPNPSAWLGRDRLAQVKHR